MKEEDKQLLLADLCARLPYGVKIRIIHHEIKGADPEYVDDVFSTTHYNMIDYDDDNYEFLPYLRPMSSMTADEIETLKSKCLHTETEEDWEGVRCDSWGIEIFEKYDTRRWDNPIWPSTINMDAIDWLNAHNFDYRGLIKRSLAIEAPEGMYGKEEQQ